MGVRRVPLGIVVPVLLVALLAVLAALQYRWLGQVSEAERGQLRRAFEQRAQDFADEFDLEVSRVYATLQLSQPDLAASNWTSFAAAVDQWQATAKFPQMLRGIYLAEPATDRIGLRAYSRETRGFENHPGKGWPAQLEPVRRQLVDARETTVPVGKGPDILRVETSQGSSSRLLTLALAALNVEVPALIIPVSTGPLQRVQAPDSSHGVTTSAPLPQATGRTPGRTFVLVRHENTHVIAELDGDYLRETVLPALAAKHFPDPGPDSYRVAVLAPSGSTLFSSGLPDGVALDPAHADVTVRLMTLRFDLALGLTTPPGAQSDRSAVPGREPGNGRATSIETRVSITDVPGGQGDGRSTASSAALGQVRVSRPAWRLVLQHGAGSLDTAVERARQRNLALSFGILAVLSVGMALVVINARRSEQLAARQMEFVATVSHELRTPLTVIRSAAQNLSAGVVANPAQAQRYGELIDSEGRRLTDMVEQVLDYAGLTGNRALRPEQLTDAGALVADAMAACQPVVEGAACVAETAIDEGLLVMADPEALRRAVQNLVTNAVKHASDGRWLGVTVKAGREPGRPEVVIAVSDRGHGIPSNELPHIFDPFYRGRDAVAGQVRGNGLGLGLVKRIVEAHGGTITVRSLPGEGSTFTIRLPAAAGVAVDATVSRESGA